MNYRVKQTTTTDGRQVWHLQAQSRKGEQWQWVSVCGLPAHFSERRKAKHVCLMLQYPEDFEKGWGSKINAPTPSA